MKERDFSMKQGCKKLVMQRYNCRVMVVAYNLLHKIYQPPKLSNIHPKSTLRLVEDRGKLLTTFDGWFVSY